MTTATLADVEAALRASWGPDTAYASPAYMRRGTGPSRGQCGPTALVVHALLGGDLVVADLEHHGQVDVVHYWNVLPDGAEGGPHPGSADGARATGRPAQGRRPSGAVLAR